MSQNQLKPCPFCGGRAKYVDLGIPSEFADWGVECTRCGVVMIAPAAEEGNVTTKKESMAAWNRRAEPLIRREKPWS